MLSFVNRDTEMTLIDDALKALQNYKEELLRTPIIDFYGVEGIGKSAILSQIKQRCEQQQLQYIFIEGLQNIKQFNQEIISQSTVYDVQIPDTDIDTDVGQALGVIKALIEKGTTVLLLDSVDTPDDALMRGIAEILKEVIDDNKLLVVLTSRRGILFDSVDRSIARKLTLYQLKPFDLESSEEYLEEVGPTLTPSVRASIFEWTRGYPKAMEVMTGLILDAHLDPLVERDQQTLISHITAEVIDDGLLAKLSVEQRERYRVALQLLSIPRRFNLAIMQDLIETFAPSLKQKNPLSYMKLPRDMQKDIDVLSWNLLKAGYAVDSAVRSIFMIKQKIEDNERYLDIHRFLADLNFRYAQDVTGFDRIRYVREYLYHSAYLGKPDFTDHFASLVGQIAREDAAEILHLLEEVKQDAELREALGAFDHVVISRLYQQLVENGLQQFRAATPADRISLLSEIIVNTLHDPLVEDKEFALRERLQAIYVLVPSQQLAEFKQEVLRSDDVRESLGSYDSLLISSDDEQVSEEG